MSDMKTLAANFLQRAKPTIAVTPRGVINSFDAMFPVQDLNTQESDAIDKLLIEAQEPGLFPAEIVLKHAAELKTLTKELKAIDKQRLIMIGERISKARKILDNYKEHSFREWLKLTYGSFKTGYNYISFFDLYTALPEDLKPLLKKMPAKAAYVLASRNAPIEKKAAIIEIHGTESAQKIITAIQTTFAPTQARKSNRRPAIDQILTALENQTFKLRGERLHLSPQQLHRLQSLTQALNRLLGTCQQITKI